MSRSIDCLNRPIRGSCRLHAIPALCRFRLGRVQVFDEGTRFRRLGGRSRDADGEQNQGLNLRRKRAEDFDAGDTKKLNQLLRTEFCFPACYAAPTGTPGGAWTRRCDTGPAMPHLSNSQMT
ncbi:hypothetical protein [Microvirga pakistanensis]|uniref:hypothetical protein n=1 Tax=Microvirga pakistanensis TaxID=1682650 RepID=UPI001FCE629D|nr:hypothetical protein [Microvirga pakistanensis]